MGKKREFSLYDIEQFLKDAGAERVNEKAVISFERELEDTVRELVDQAAFYANYAGRSKLIKNSDIRLAIARTARSMRISDNRRRRHMPESRLKMNRLNIAVERMLNQRSEQGQ